MRIRAHDQAEWQRKLPQICSTIIKDALHQCKHMRNALRSIPEDKIIAYANPKDLELGTGYGRLTEENNHPTRWRGKNILGHALRANRKRLVDDAQCQKVPGSASLDSS